MNDNVFDIAHEIFNEIVKNDPKEYEFHLSEKIKFPKIENSSIPIVNIPLPRKIDSKISFEGMTFDNYEIENKTIWSLFLASIYHIGGHFQVSDYSIYEKWMQNKTRDVCFRVIDYIEDVKVNRFLKKNFSEVWENIELINVNFTNLFKTLNDKNCKKNTLRIFAEHFQLSKQKNHSNIHKQIINHDDNKNIDGIVDVADNLYKSRELLPDFIFPYCEHRIDDEKLPLIKKSIRIQPAGTFRDNAVRISEMWVNEMMHLERKFKKYNKYSKNLNVDVEIGNENFNEYLHLKSKHSMLINKVKTQLRSVKNIRDDPEPWHIGIVDMQKAIQSIASDNSTLKFHDLDFERRVDERWVIILDTSSSMKLRFNEMRTLALCLAESANELILKGGQWSMITIGHKIQIIKDMHEKFNPTIKSRIGGIKYPSGLSFLPDAINFAINMLADNVADRKYIFFITDGYSLGYEKIDENFAGVAKNVFKNGINMIGIGVAKGQAKFFTNSFSDPDFRKTISKFIRIYFDISVQNM